MAFQIEIPSRPHQILFISKIGFRISFQLSYDMFRSYLRKIIFGCIQFIQDIDDLQVLFINRFFADAKSIVLKYKMNHAPPSSVGRRTSVSGGVYRW